MPVIFHNKINVYFILGTHLPRHCRDFTLNCIGLSFSEDTRLQTYYPIRSLYYCCGKLKMI